MQALRLLDVYKEHRAFQILCDKSIHLSFTFVIFTVTLLGFSIKNYKFRLCKEIPRDIRQTDYFSRVH